MNYLKIKYNFTAGSDDSINFLVALNNSKHSEIFSTEAVKNLINYKWYETIWLGYIHLILYFGLMNVMIFGHCTYPEDIKWILVLWCYLGYITLSFLKIFVGKLSIYNTDSWYFFDFLLIGFLGGYMIFHHIGIDKENSTQ